MGHTESTSLGVGFGSRTCFKGDAYCLEPGGRRVTVRAPKVVFKGSHLASNCSFFICDASELAPNLACHRPWGPN